MFYLYITALFEFRSGKKSRLTQSVWRKQLTSSPGSRSQAPMLFFSSSSLYIIRDSRKRSESSVASDPRRKDDEGPNDGHYEKYFNSHILINTQETHMDTNKSTHPLHSHTHTQRHSIYTI